VEAVLVIPTLPPDVAAAALAEVTGGWPFARRDLRRAARRARAAIHAGLKDVPDAQPAETALDVCLFVKGER
jgi:hypothetical protein